MYNAIRDTIVIANICFFGMSLGMNRDVVMRNLVSKEAIPMLALNNYVVDASTAYEAFYKEAHLAEEALKKMKNAALIKIKLINDNYRRSLLKDGGGVYTFNASKIRCRMMNPVRRFQFRRIGIKYNFNQNEPISATMKIKFFEYCVFQSNYQSQKYFIKEYVVQQITSSLLLDQLKYILLKEQLARYLQLGKFYIELHSSYDHSDWIKVSIPICLKKSEHK